MFLSHSKALWTLQGVYLVCLTQDQNISSWVSACRACMSNCIAAHHHTTRENPHQQGSGRKALSSVQGAALLWSLCYGRMEQGLRPLRQVQPQRHQRWGRTAKAAREELPASCPLLWLCLGQQPCQQCCNTQCKTSALYSKPQ